MIVLIELTGVTKKINTDFTLDNITFSVGAGETLGVLGRRGAGKTTLADIMAGCLLPTSGSVTVCGYDLVKNLKDAKRRIGYMPEGAQPYQNMAVKEYLEFVCALRVNRRNAAACAHAAAETAGVTAFEERLIKNLGESIKRRVALAGAICAGPEVLVLDEPTAGLNPEEAASMREVIESLRGGRTVVLLSRSIHEVTQLCGNAVFLVNGEIAARETIDNLLKAVSDQRRVKVRLSADRKTGLSLLKGIKCVDYVECLGCNEKDTHDFVVESSGADTRAEIFRAAAEAGAVLLGMSLMAVTLDDICAQLSGDNREAGL